jgi:hypothetical protein
MNLGDLYEDDPIREARRVWARRGNKVVQKYRCTAGWRKGRLVATPASCSKPLDIKKRYTIKKTRARLGPRIARRTKRMKRFNPITRRITSLNKSTRPKIKSGGSTKWWIRQ